MSNATIAPEVSRTASTAELRLPFEATAPAAEAWLLSLSTLSFSDSCRHLYHALRAVNRLDLAAHQRLQLLETLRPQILNRSSRFDHCFSAQTFPLPDKIARAVRLAIQFQAELALGYQRVLESSQCATTFGPDQQATTAHRALSAYGLYLLRSAQSYLPPAAGLWGKIHQAYRCAESLGVAHRAVVDPDGPYASSASADECLRKIVLFQLALPTRLRQSEIAELYDWIDANIPLVRLQKERAFNLQEAQFFVDLAKDGNPQPIGALVTPHADIRYLFLEPSLLVQLRTGAACSTFGTDLAQRFAPLDDEGEEAQCRTALFATGAEGGAALLEAELAKVKQRLKTPERANLELHPGHAPARSPLSARVAQRFGESRQNPPHVSRDEIWGRTDPDALAAAHSSEGLLRYHPEQGRLSLCGDRRQLRIGQLVVVAAENMKPLAGIIRNVAAASDTTRVWANVELVPGLVSAARAHIEGEHRRRLPALLIVEDPARQDSASVMLLPTVFPNGTWITLEQNGLWTNQRLARLVEATDDFCQYRTVAAD